MKRSFDKHKKKDLRKIAIGLTESLDDILDGLKAAGIVLIPNGEGKTCINIMVQDPEHPDRMIVGHLHEVPSLAEGIHRAIDAIAELRAGRPPQGMPIRPSDHSVAKMA